jgi:hypothetical protein
VVVVVECGKLIELLLLVGVGEGAGVVFMRCYCWYGEGRRGFVE